MSEYRGGTLLGLDAHSHEVGGVADHVHLVVSMKPTQMIAKVLQELKIAASAWVHEEMQVPEFASQDGYAAFTVSASLRVRTTGSRGPNP